MPRSSRLSTIESLDIFDGCGQDQKAHIEGLIGEKIYRNGETIIAQGKPFPVVGTILQGVAVVEEIRMDGSEAIMAFLLPTDLIGMPDETPSMFNIVAAGTVRLACMSLQNFMQVIETTPSVAINAMSRALDRLELVRGWVVQANHLNARERLIALIALMGLRDIQAGLTSAEDPILLNIPVSREQIGNLLGLGLYTVSRLMGELKQEGLIQFDGPHLIKIPDLNRLFDICGCETRIEDGQSPNQDSGETLMAPL